MKDIFLTDDAIMRKKLKTVHHEVLKTLFGTSYIAEITSIILVLLSVILAVFIPHTGLFLTSQNEGMSKYHRWLYDVFVLASCTMLPIFYFWLRKNNSKADFRRAWQNYIHAHAAYKFYRFKQVKLQAQNNSLHSMAKEFVVLLFFIFCPIILYSLITLSGNTHRGNFIIKTWWPINAVIIGIFYYGQFWLFFRLVAVKEIMLRFERLRKTRH
ncbi:hypothetical protein [Acinetobacter sp. MD2]|uniref:hypothetical protein n=1 Tax=Acinetobacter sp. MD2 TaxID=2600066 RepID=UPI002D1E89C8|nr:hypothetical protein [Acinetobacter sp. MD2]MEB3766198.1 hypothetical protein [Acinetobacter sp. MD2]